MELLYIAIKTWFIYATALAIFTRIIAQTFNKHSLKSYKSCLIHWIIWFFMPVSLVLFWLASTYILFFKRKKMYKIKGAWDSYLEMLLLGFDDKN